MLAGWKKTLKIAAAMAVVAGSMAMGATPAAADPSDPICIMSPEDYCQYHEGLTWGSAPYRACLHNVAIIQVSGYCDDPL